MYKRSKKIMAMVMSAAMVLSMTAVTRAEAADKKDNIEIRLASSRCLYISSRKLRNLMLWIMELP